MRVPVVFLAALAFAGSRAEAQQRILRGIVTDSAGYPLSNVDIRIMEIGRAARSDAKGHFAFERISDRIVDLTFRRLGYELRRVRVSLINGEGDSLRVVMRLEPLLLKPVEIQEERHPFFAEYERRRERGIGSFITQKDLEKLNTSAPSDAFRRMPGMIVSPGGVRFVSSIGMTGARNGARSTGCAPTIWMDGQAAVGMEIDEIRAQDIHGIEIYRGAATTPPQFAKYGTAQCGTIVVWTRRKTK